MSELPNRDTTTADPRARYLNMTSEQLVDELVRLDAFRERTLAEIAELIEGAESFVSDSTVDFTTRRIYAGRSAALRALHRRITEPEPLSRAATERNKP